LRVDTFNNIQLAIVRPGGAISPAINICQTVDEISRLNFAVNILTHKAGHVPQIPPGIWAISAMNKACK
jgi:hypothetical protein